MHELYDKNDVVEDKPTWGSKNKINEVRKPYQKVLYHKRADLDKVDLGTNGIDAVQEEYVDDLMDDMEQNQEI